MNNKQSEALIFANDRPDSTSDDLYQWSTDAEEMIRHQHAMIIALEAQLAVVQRVVQETNECRITLITQIHELADHVERAASFVSDSDMCKQMLGQRDFAFKVASKWNQNGNPFASTSSQAIEQTTDYKKP